MKKLALLVSAIAYLLIVSISHSQTLTFCEGVDDSGAAIGASNTFKIPFTTGGYFYFLVQLPKATNCKEVSYDIYQIKEGSENYYTSISQTGLTNEWTWFWKKATFYDAGTYRVYVNDCNGATLASSIVTIKYE